MRSTSSKYENYRPDIDGLRAIAILSVIVFHAFPSIAQGGFVGVDVFFVISGYLISRIVFSGLERRDFSFATFYSHRIKRIFPALILVLTACYTAGWFALLPKEYAQLGKHMAAGAGFVQNIVLWHEAGYFDVTAELKPLMHLWSLAVEEQFYLIYPLLIWVAWRAKHSVLWVMLVVGLLSFGLNIAGVSAHPAEVFFAAHTRFWELLAGGWLAYLNLFQRERVASFVKRLAFPSAAFKTPLEANQSNIASNVIGTLGLTLILIAVFVVSKANAFPGWWALMPVAGSWLVIFAGADAWVNRRLLGNRAMVFVGLISYPLYLWHWPMLSFLRILELEPSLAQRAGAIAISFLAAWLTYRLIERPVRFGRSKQITVYVLVALLLVVGYLGFNAFQRQGLGFRFPAEIQPVVTYAYDYKVKIHDGKCWLNGTDTVDAFSAECLGAATNPGTADSVLIWGDSHAARLYFGFQDRSVPGEGVAVLARDSCPPTLNYGYPVCVASNRYVFSLIAKQKPETVVLFAVWDSYAQRWPAGSQQAAALLNTVAELKGVGIKNIVVMGPAPHWVQDLPKLAFKGWLRHRTADLVPERMNQGLVPTANAVDQDLKTLVRPDGSVTYFSVLESLCNADGCLVRTNPNPTSFTTWDYGHLTAQGAVEVVKKLAIDRQQSR